MPDAISNEPSVIERTRIPLKAPAQSLWSAVLAKVKNVALANGPIWFAAKIDPGSHDVEDFEIESQCFENWCWAAVGASIGRLSKVGSKPPQCEVAKNQVQDKANGEDLSKAPCHVTGKPYDVPGSLSAALKFVGCSRDMLCHEDNSDGFCIALSSKPDLEDIQKEIRNKNPVCFRIGDTLPEGRRHFVVISGFRPGGCVVVKDPDGGTTQEFVNYKQFPGSEKNWILWNTYFTKRD